MVDAFAIDTATLSSIVVVGEARRTNIHSSRVIVEISNTLFHQNRGLNLNNDTVVKEKLARRNRGGAFNRLGLVVASLLLLAFALLSLLVEFSSWGKRLCIVVAAAITSQGYLCAFALH